MDGIDTNLGALTPVAAASSPVRTSAPEPAAATTTAASATQAGATNNLISLLADAAPPIDSKKVEAIRSLIGAGRYPIDEHAIAAKMIALDVASFKAA